MCVLWEERIFPSLKWNIWQLEQVIIAVTKRSQLQQLWIPCSATHNQLSVYLDTMLPSPKYTLYSTYSVFKAMFVIIGKNDKITILIKITTNSPTQQLWTDISGTLLMKFYSSRAQMWREKCSQKLSQRFEHMWFLIAWQRRCLIQWTSWKQPVSAEEIQHDIIEPVWQQRGRALFGLLWWWRGETWGVGARLRWARAGDPACLTEYPFSLHPCDGWKLPWTSIGKHFSLLNAFICVWGWTRPFRSQHCSFKDTRSILYTSNRRTKYNNIVLNQFLLAKVYAAWCSRSLQNREKTNAMSTTTKANDENICHRSVNTCREFRTK